MFVCVLSAAREVIFFNFLIWFLILFLFFLHDKSTSRTGGLDRKEGKEGKEEKRRVAAINRGLIGNERVNEGRAKRTH
jgi:hypothetical protein